MRLGFKPEYRILETGHSIEWRVAEHRWIERFRAEGRLLLNRTAGGEGVQTLSAGARQRLSEYGSGRPKSPSHRAKISAAQKGQAKQWSEEGQKRVVASRFKPGHNNWEKLTAETKASVIRRSKEQWNVIPAAERSGKARERANTTWSKRSEAERKSIGIKISASRLKIPAERRSELSKKGALARLGQPGAANEFGRKIKNWWATLTEADKQDFIARRAVAIKKAKAAKSGGS